MELEPEQIDETAEGSSLASEHIAAKVEDKYLSVLNGSLRAFAGWQPRVEPFTGLGNPDKLRVLGRVLLSPVRPESERRKPHARGFRSYLAIPAPNERVEIQIGDFTCEAVSDRNGYLDFELDLPDDQPMKPGWQQVRFMAKRSGQQAKGSVRIIGDDATIGVISDIDDTTMVTMVPDLALAAWNTMITPTSERKPVTGMPALYQAIDQRYPDAPFVYLSSGAWNTARNLRRFLAVHGYPAGPLLLTDFGPTRTGWFRHGKTHKKQQITWLMDLFPKVRWFMFGDDGQEDPEIYAEAVERFPGRVKAIGIRSLSAVERVLWVRWNTKPPAHGEKKNHRTKLPVDAVEVPESAFDVPIIEGHDGESLAAEFRRYGLL